VKLKDADLENVPRLTHPAQKVTYNGTHGQKRKEKHTIKSDARTAICMRFGCLNADLSGVLYMENMMPCPFCGSKSISEGESLIEHEGKKYSQAGCTDCGAFGPVKRCPDGINYGPERDFESTRAWNSRV